MAKKTKDSNLSIEKRLEQALIPNWDEPYKLPDNWCWTKIGIVTNIYRGVSYKKHEGHSEKGKDDCLVMRGGNIQEGKIDVNADNIYVSKELISDEQYVKKHDVVIVSSTGSTKVIGRAGISFADYDDVAFGAFLTLVRPVETLYKPYVSYYFQGDMYRNRMRQLASGVNINNIRNEYITDTPFPMPPLEEQKRIVSHIELLFAKLDEAKEKAQEVVDGFETRKAAILHKAFSGELCTIDSSSNLDEILSDIFSYRENLIKSKIIQRAKLQAMEDKDIISSFPSRWKQLKLGEISFITKLAGFEYTKYIKLEESGDIPVVRAQNVKKGYLDTTNLLYIDRQTSENLIRSALDKPSLLITFIGAGIGDVCVFDKPQRFHLAPNVAKVEPYCDENGAINIKFLLYYLLSPSGQKEIFKSMKAVAQPSLSMETIRDIVIPFTTKEEQDEIVRIVDNLISKEQQAKEAAEAVIDQIDTMKKAILARAFRGELGTNDPSEESALELLKSVLMGNTNQQEPQKSSKKSISIPNHIETALLTKLEKKIVSLFYTTERKVVSVDEIMSVSSKKIDIIDTLTKLEQRGILIRLNNSCYRIKE